MCTSWNYTDLHNMKISFTPVRLLWLVLNEAAHRNTVSSACWKILANPNITNEGLDEKKLEEICSELCRQKKIKSIFFVIWFSLFQKISIGCLSRRTTQGIWKNIEGDTFTYTEIHFHSHFQLLPPFVSSSATTEQLPGGHGFSDAIAGSL